MLHYENHRVPVTALAFTTNYLLSGEGSHVRIYNRKEVASGWLASRQVFVRQAIHGIAVSATENVLLIWGGSSIRAFALLEPSRDSDEPRISLSRTVHTSDWILDAVFRPDVEPRGGDGTYEVVLLTAHNALTSLSISRTSSVSPTVTDGQSQDPSGFVQITIEENLHELTSSSKCILYSAHLKWIEDHRILIASGTAFGEMILWSCTIRPGAPAVARLHQLLTGHEGSIFGVKISDPLPEPLPARLLASCSDDRTIRIWDIANLPESEIGPQMATDARETGFGNNLIGTIPGEARENTWAARAWGHLSRIWGVSFILSSELGPSLHLASFGEDATCQYWRLQAERSSNGGEDVKLRLQHLGFSSLHSGKNLWASAIALEAGEGVVIATGGADGSIALQTKSLPFVDAKATSQAWPIEQAVAAVPSGQRAKEKFRSYAYITKDELLLTMDTGDVMLLRTGRAGEEQTEQGSAWQWLGREEDIRGYSVVTSVPALSMAFFAGMKGTVFVYHPDTGIKEFGKCEGKVAALIASYQPESDNMPEHAALIATTVESKTASLYTLALHPEVIEQAKETVLQLPAGLVVTSLLVAVESKHEQAARQLPGVILGSRNGSLAVYQLGKADQGISLMPDYVLPRAHGQDAVTALAWIPNSSGAAVSGWVFSVGRDGTLSVHEAYLGASPVQMRLAHRTNLPVGPNLEGLRVDKQGRLLVWGFKSKHFVLYDVINEREIMSVECGGAHRNWSFNLLPTLDGGNLAWTKASGLYTQAHVKSSCQTTGAGGHGREIKALAVSPPMQGSRSVGDAKIQLVATGAEDTDIKIFRDDKDVRGRPNMQCLRTLRKHNTGIQQLQWSEDGSHLFSSGGFEEFFVWKINLVPVIGVAVFCESACPSKSELPDLRIMAFDVTTICGGDKTKESAMFNISMVYSDSTLKVYRYFTLSSGGQWHLLLTGDYLSSCLTQACYLSAGSTSTLVTAATDGHVAIWSLNKAFSNDAIPETGTPLMVDWERRSKIHQNSIHSLSAHQLGDNSWLLVTGGDDNGLGLSRLHIGEAAPAPECASLIVPRAHAAAVTALAVVPQPHTSDELWVVTGSIDQRLKLWNVQVDPSLPGVEGLQVRKLQDMFTPVADVSSIAVLEVSRGGCAVLVCGVGMDVRRMYFHADRVSA